MIVPFKFLPHEILNKPKPAPTIRIFPQANRETSDASQAGDHHLCPPLITEPTTHKPQKKKKKKGDPRKPINHPTKNRGV